MHKPTFKLIHELKKADMKIWRMMKYSSDHFDIKENFNLNIQISTASVNN